LCKGYDLDAEVKAELDRLGVRASFEVLPDDGVDIGAYFAGARSVKTEFVCFLNSFSEIVSPNWLDKLMRGLQQPGVGVAGATGSFESAAYAHALGLRRRWRSLIRSRNAIGKAAADLLRLTHQFPWYPNPHLRTNAFVLRTTLFTKLRLAGPDKFAALLFESGYRSMTRQLRAQRLDSVVVGADGGLFEIKAWPTSGTFRAYGQNNLLVQDNQTRRYEQSISAEQSRLGRYAWGKHFRP